MVNRTIPRLEWDDFFASLSCRLYGNRCEIDVIDRELIAIDPNLPAERDHRVISFGGIRREEGALALLNPDDSTGSRLSAPIRVSIEESERGAVETLEIECSDGLAARILFR
jgi:hypothetical protein